MPPRRAFFSLERALFARGKARLFPSWPVIAIIKGNFFSVNEEIKIYWFYWFILEN